MTSILYRARPTPVAILLVRRIRWGRVALTVAALVLVGSAVALVLP
jgi:hypothetical protein